MGMCTRAFMIALISAAAAWWPASGDAVELQSHASIRATARTFMLSQIRGSTHRKVAVQAGALDSRLRLPACPVSLQAFLPPGGRTIGNATVGVRCTAGKPWSLYVPVRVSVHDRVAVASRALARGQVISAADLTWREHDIARLPFGYIADPKGAIGKVLKRAVGAGKVLTPALLSAPLMVRRGQTVTLVAGGDALAVRMAGRALMDGSRGDLVRVRNTHSDHVVQGIVVAPGQVRVGS